MRRVGIGVLIGSLLIVAIADEIHQAYIPSRDASITDVLLDAIGIVLALLIVYHAYKKAGILSFGLSLQPNLS
jgi:VanZ family protein